MRFVSLAKSSLNRGTKRQPFVKHNQTAVHTDRRIAMQEAPKITFRNVDESSTVRQSIERHVLRLERFFPRIIGCKVLVEVPHRHHRKGSPYHVRVDVNVPGNDIVVNPHPRNGGGHDDVYIAISDTFSATIRRLQDYARIRRGRVKHCEYAPMPDTKYELDEMSA
jgi:ribosome-associated translation inhibitor RaiA